MKFSEQWLREWVDPAVSAEELMEQLTMAGLEVDGYGAASSEFSGVVVAEVLSVAKHPDADKLSVCQVSDGKSEFQVVCGAPNVRANLKVPYATVGAVLGKDFKIRKAKLRGVESFGMLCAEEELGLSDSADGLMELAADAPIGADLRDYLQLDDTLIDVDLTPNRGDCLGIKGLAREVGVLNRQDVRELSIEAVESSIEDTFPVELESPADCPRYLGRVIRNINVSATTPLWMKEKLRRSDIRSIDPVVDVTNYILMELGQPMHAFDLDTLDKGIRVRTARQGEKLILLDEREVELSAGTLVIADHNKPLAIAGVMGGLDSSVTDSTSNIFLESAFFDPIAIAGKARSYGLQTDAAHRFERGVDYELAKDAIERATHLLLDIVGGQAGPVVEAVADLPHAEPVVLRESRIRRLLGVEIPAADIEEMLQRLGIQLKCLSAGEWQCEIPSWRFDIRIEADLVEEVARIYGYDNLPVTRPETAMSLKPASEFQVGMKRSRHLLAAQGYQEVITYSFIDAELDGLLRGEGEVLELSNPISQDMSVMRSSLWPGLLKTLKHNSNRQINRLKLFESGLVFISNNKKLEQIPRIGGMLWGGAYPEQWSASNQDFDYFDAKGDVESLLQQTNAADQFSFVPAEHPALQKGQTARIVRKTGEQETAVGWLGALSPKLQRQLDITGKVYIFELDQKLTFKADLPVAQELSKFPSVRRDMAIVVEEGENFADIQNVIFSNAGENVTELTLFDVYRGQNIEKGQKSLALGLTFQHPSRTLNDDEINVIIDKCIKALEQQFNAKLR